MLSKRLNMPILEHPYYSKRLTLTACGSLDLVIAAMPVPMTGTGMDSHRQYEFFIPMTHVPRFIVGDAEMECLPGQIISINPGQPHGLAENCGMQTFIMIFISREWMNQLVCGRSGDICRGFSNEPRRLRPDIISLVWALSSAEAADKIDPDQPDDHLAEQLAMALIEAYYLASEETPEILDPVPNVRPAPAQSAGSGQPCPKQDRFVETLSLMNQRYREPLTIRQMAGIAGMNNYHFIRCFKKRFQMSPYQYLIKIRIRIARRLLRETGMPVAEIGAQCGFKSASRFAAVFYQNTGQRPGRYRRACHCRKQRPW